MITPISPIRYVRSRGTAKARPASARATIWPQMIPQPTANDAAAATPAPQKMLAAPDASAAICRRRWASSKISPSTPSIPTWKATITAARWPLATKSATSFTLYVPPGGEESRKAISVKTLKPMPPIPANVVVRLIREPS